MATVSASIPAGQTTSGGRWVQLAVGIVGMVAIANLQYGWTLFVNPIDSKFHWGKPAIQIAFTVFVLAETWLVPFEGYLVDRFGPRWLVAIGGVLVGAAWWVNAQASSLFALYTGGLIGGVGAGIVYGTSVGNALKWFPERRGLAAGLTAAAFGAGSALTIVPIANIINTRGYEVAFLYFGLGQGLVVILCALLLRAPRKDEVPVVTTSKVQQSVRDFTPVEMMKTPVFWLLYVMMTMLAMGGLMATAQAISAKPDMRAKELRSMMMPSARTTATVAAMASACPSAIGMSDRKTMRWLLRLRPSATAKSQPIAGLMP